MLPSSPNQARRRIGDGGSPLAWSPRPALVGPRYPEPGSSLALKGGSAQARGFASCEVWPGRAGAWGGGRTPKKAQSRLPLARDALGREKPDLGEQDFLASWARLLGPAAQGPLCGGARLRRRTK